MADPVITMNRHLIHQTINHNKAEQYSINNENTISQLIRIIRSIITVCIYTLFKDQAWRCSANEKINSTINHINQGRDGTI